MPNIERILICGGGIAGLTLANALRRRGLEFELVERNADWAPIGGGIAVQPNAIRALHHLGLGAEVERAGTRIRQWQFRNSRGVLLAEIALEPLWGSAGAFMGVERRALHRVLLAGSGTQFFRLSTWPTSLTQAGRRASVEFSDGTRADYDLVIGADGIHSAVRSLAFDAPQPSYGGQMVWRSIAAMPAPVPDAVQFWLGDGCFFGFCPVAHDRTYVFANATGARHHDEIEGRADRLRRRFSDFGEPVQDYLAHLSDQHIHCGPIEWLELDRWYTGRVLLVGDAAHATSPMMGQGGCMAIEDALVLSEVLSPSCEVENALTTFVSRRRPRVNWVQQQSRMVGEMLSWPSSERDAAIRTHAAKGFYQRYQPLTIEP